MKLDEPKVTPAKIEVDHSFSMRDALNVVFCHKWKILLFFLTVVSTVSIITYRLPYFYASEATLLIGVGPDPTSIAPKILGPAQYLNQGQIERVNNEVTILTSRHLAKQVVDSVGLKVFFPRLDKRTNEDGEIVYYLGKNLVEGEWLSSLNEVAINQLVGGLSVEVKPKSFILNLTLINRDAQVAHNALKGLIDGYLVRRIELRRPEKSVNVFSERFEEYKQVLEAKEQALVDFRIKNNIASMGTQRDLLIRNIASLQERSYTTKNEITALREKAKQLKMRLETLDPRIELQRTEGRTNYVADALKNLLFKLEAEEAEISSRYLDDSRQVQEIREQIRRLRGHLKKEDTPKAETTFGLNQNYQRIQVDLMQAEVEYESYSRRQAAIDEELERQTKELARLSELELTLRRLERDVDIASKDYTADREVLQRASSYEALNERGVVNVEIIEPPTIDDEHVKPNKPRNIILGMVLGLLGGLGLAFILDYFDDSMKTSEDVKRRLKLPVLAIISTPEFQKCVVRHHG